MTWTWRPEWFEGILSVYWGWMIEAGLRFFIYETNSPVDRPRRLDSIRALIFSGRTMCLSSSRTRSLYANVNI